MQTSTVFLSYSRRQLYFAEALALQLQQAGLDVWFDLQQLHAGSVWSDGLKDGVQDAGRLVLVVSQAALDSQWTKAEWQGMAGKGAQIVLAVFEPVVLPEELRGLPTFDFRSGFDKQAENLAAYLAGRIEPRHDRIEAPSRRGLPLKLPPALWLILLALAAPLLCAVLTLPFTVGQWKGGFSVAWGFFAFFAACAAAIAALFALPFWRRSISYKNLRRGLFWSGMLSVVMMMPVAFVAQPNVPVGLLAVAFLVTLYSHVWLIRRSGALLRWMPPDEGLQALRRRAHQPLRSASSAGTVLNEADKAPWPPFTYALHADAADQPLAQRVESILAQQGHRRVKADGAAQHRLAILSNRSSQAWVEALTQQHAGSLVWVVASTIELGEGLSQTQRYQWVDFRGGDRRDIEMLARSLANPAAASREAALEATPEMIDRWKVPSGISLLRTVTEVFGVFILVFGASDLIGAGLAWWCPGLFGPFVAERVGRSTLLSVLGVVLLWTVSNALVYRRVPAVLVYGLLVTALTGVTLAAEVLPEFLRPVPWVPLVLYLPIVLFSLPDGRHWLPGRAPSHPDEVGIKRSIEQDFHRSNIVKVVIWITLIVGLAGTEAWITAAGKSQGGGATASRTCEE